MKLKTLNEWLNESNQGFLEPTKENLREYRLDPNKVTVNPDGSIDYDGDVDITWKILTSIPFKFNKVSDSFFCFGNRLVSLAGAPTVVNGGFDCRWNKLASLEGSPSEVHGNFDCSSNRLVSLEGCPRVVEGDFNCYSNQLVSLEGCPEVVEGDFHCYSNQLVSLGGFQETVVKKDFDCSPNLILYNPTKYKGSFDINQEWPIRDTTGEWTRYSFAGHLRMAFGRLDELSKEEIIGIEEGLKKVEIPDDLRAYCEEKLYKFLVKYNPKTKTQKFFHDAEMDDDLLGML